MIAKANYISKKRQAYLIAIEFDDRVLDFDLLHLRSHRADMGGEHRGIRLGRGRRKGRTKYRDMKTEDTGRWGDFSDRRPRRDGDVYDGRDDRFMSDSHRNSGPERSGANASALGERKRPGDSGGGESKRMKAS